LKCARFSLLNGIMNKPKTEKNVRANKLIKKLIGIAGLFVKSFYFEGACLVVQVRPVWRIPRCSHCGRICSGYDHKADPVCWVHLEIGTTRFIIKYAPRRVECPCCGVRVELVPWARPGSRFTRPFEEKTAYLAQITNKTEVSKLMGIAWRTVGNIIQRVVNDKLDPKRLDGLSRIGIDEISFRKNHRYITTVVDHATRRIVWAAEGKSSETLNKFFEELGEERAKKISIITIDMSAAFIKSIEEKVPHAQIIFDLFHVLKLSSEAVDKVRRKLISGLKERDDSENASAIKKSRYVLLKNPWDLTSKEWGKLCSIQQHNAGL
jgi:transposase